MGRGLQMGEGPGIGRRHAGSSIAWARRLSLGLLPFLLVPQGLGATPVCRALQDQRDRLSREAMQAEIALVQTIRRRLCPREEALAEQANANGQPSGAPGVQQAPLDFGAYIRCREQAERLLGRTRPVLYRNQNGFLFFTAAGARLARSADGLVPQLTAACAVPQAQPSP